jgi:ankyrin repeat protein
MKTQFGKRNGCKFASDAVLRGDWVALHGLMVQGGLSADCPFPSNESVPVQLTTWARRYNSTHPNRSLIKHELEAEISFGTPLLHQVVMAEGIDNKKSFAPGIKLLLDRGADIDLQDRANGYTALHIACMLCRSNLMEFLLSKKAKRDIKSWDGQIATELMPRWCKTVIKADSSTDEADYDEMSL